MIPFATAGPIGSLLIGEGSEISAFGKDTPQAVIQSSILHKPVHPAENATGMKDAHRRLSIIDIAAGAWRVQYF